MTSLTQLSAGGRVTTGPFRRKMGLTFNPPSLRNLFVPAGSGNCRQHGDVNRCQARSRPRRVASSYPHPRASQFPRDQQTVGLAQLRPEPQAESVRSPRIGRIVSALWVLELAIQAPLVLAYPVSIGRGEHRIGDALHPGCERGEVKVTETFEDVLPHAGQVCRVHLLKPGAKQAGVSTATAPRASTRACTRVASPAWASRFTIRVMPLCETPHKKARSVIRIWQSGASARFCRARWSLSERPPSVTMSAVTTRGTAKTTRISALYAAFSASLNCACTSRDPSARPSCLLLPHSFGGQFQHLVYGRSPGCGRWRRRPSRSVSHVARRAAGISIVDRRRSCGPRGHRSHGSDWARAVRPSEERLLDRGQRDKGERALVLDQSRTSSRTGARLSGGLSRHPGGGAASRAGRGGWLSPSLRRWRRRRSDCRCRSWP